MANDAKCYIQALPPLILGGLHIQMKKFTSSELKEYISI